MLLSFRFANHRSFRDEQQLDLTPVYGSDGGPSSPAAVPVAGVFGANASGKSNALGALAFMRRWAIQSDREVEPGLGIDRDPFRLDASSAGNPSRYVVDLALDGIRHTYGFTLDNECVVEEWLYHYPLKKKRIVFEREYDAFRWGEESARRSDLERIAGITASTALFLSTVARFGSRRTRRNEGPRDDPLHDTYTWFRYIRARSRPGLRRFPLALTWPELAETDRTAVVGLLRAADVGIIDVQLKGDTEQGALFPLEASVEMSQGIDESPAVRRRLDYATARRVQRRLQFTHRGVDTDVQFEVGDESAGTQQLLELAMDAAITLRNGSLLTVDEIDASLHPMLTARLIGLFQDPGTNPRSSQLVFTSHDAALLGTFDTEEVLRRDQIWFTEKNEHGASALYPLSDFRPRKEGENRQRRYLNGNYGGVPNLAIDLFEQAITARAEIDPHVS